MYDIILINILLVSINYSNLCLDIVDINFKLHKRYVAYSELSIPYFLDYKLSFLEQGAKLRNFLASPVKIVGSTTYEVVTFVWNFKRP